jgi:hypothetical protein
MITRCNSDIDRYRRNYKDRGIAVCERWRNSFTAFLADVGKKPGKGFTFDRIDNDKGYEPGNVRWTTQSRQMRNTRLTRMLNVNGTTKSIADWADDYGLEIETIKSRIKLGWPTDRLLSPAKYSSQALVKYKHSL